MKPIIILLMPEILLTFMVVIMLLIEVIFGKKWLNSNYILAITAMLGAGYLAQQVLAKNTNIITFGFCFNNNIMLLKTIICILATVVLLYSKQYLITYKILLNEYLLLYIVLVLAALLLVSSNNFLNMYLALELLALPLYALITFGNKCSIALEATLKYFLLNVIASVLLLYGISLFYGATGEFAFVIPGVIVNTSLFASSLAFIIIGMIFKLGLMPLHMWLPDVYEGAPIAVTAIIATVPKLAVMPVIFRILFTSFYPLAIDWQNIIMVLALCSIGFGNLVAIVQDDFKRMLAYSTIANIGFAVLGLLLNEQAGFIATMFYLLAYSLMYLGIFGVLLLLTKDGGEFKKIKDFQNLSLRYPGLAVVLLLLLFSLVGMPPLLGFCAKFYLLKLLIAQGFLWGSGLALLLSTIGVYYCLKLGQIMFFSKTNNCGANIKV